LKSIYIVDAVQSLKQFMFKKNWSQYI